MIIRGVNVFPSQIEEIILQEPALAPHYQITLSKKGRMDAIAVTVEGRTGAQSGRASFSCSKRGGAYKSAYRYFGKNHTPKNRAKSPARKVKPCALLTNVRIRII